MNMNQIAVYVAKKEGLKKSISIAQIKEVMRILNDLTCGELYDRLSDIKKIIKPRILRLKKKS